MRGFLLLFRRDLQQRWMLFVASFAMGLFIAAIPLLKGSRLSPAELRGAAGLTAALIWCAVLAILLGGSIFTRDLTEHRLAFDFRLPVRPSAIWAARLLAAIVTIALSAGLLLASPAAAGMDWTGAAAGLDELIGHGVKRAVACAPLAILALVFLANSITLAARSRQSWTGVDLFSIALLCTSVYFSLELLRRWQADNAIRWAIIQLVGICLSGATLATYLQVARGRTEVDVAQKRVSLTLLAVAILAGSAISAYSNWYIRPEPSQLVGENAEAQGLGPDWVSVIGRTKRDAAFLVRFLLAPSSGRTVRLGPVELKKTIAGVQLSRGGTRIAWLEWDGSTSSIVRLHVLGIAKGEEAPKPTAITWRLPIGGWALSRDGDAVASLQRTGGSNDPRRVVVETIDSGAIEASILVPDCKVDGPVLFFNRREVLVACGERHYIFDAGLWSGVFRVHLSNHTVTEFEPGMFLRPEIFAPVVPGPPRPTRPIHWLVAEQDEAFEGPGATDSISVTQDGRIFWLDPMSRTLKPLFKEQQYKKWPPGTSVNECRGFACREAEQRSQED